MAKVKKKAEDTEGDETSEAPPEPQQATSDQRAPVGAPTQIPSDAVVVDLTSPDTAPEAQPSVVPSIQPIQSRAESQELESVVTKPSKSPKAIKPPKSAGSVPASTQSRLTPHRTYGSLSQAGSNMQSSGLTTAPGRVQTQPAADDAFASFHRMREVIKDMDLSLATMDLGNNGASLGGPAMQEDEIYTPGPTATELMQLDEQEPVAQPMGEDAVSERDVNMDQPKEAEDEDMQDSQCSTQSDAFLEASRQLASNLRREEQQASQSMAASNPSQIQGQHAQTWIASNPFAVPESSNNTFNPFGPGRSLPRAALRLTLSRFQDTPPTHTTPSRLKGNLASRRAALRTSSEAPCLRLVCSHRS